MYDDEIPVGRATNLTGKTFGRWTVLYRTHNASDKKVQWKCKCQCGIEKPVRAELLVHGLSQSCECLKNELTSKRSQKDYSNQRFGRLIAISPTKQRSGNNVIWKCQCDCGNITYVSSNNLVTGHVQSCGCLKADTSSVNYIGQRFGKLVVLRDSKKRSANRNIIWECKCDCGNIVEVDSNSLRSKNTTSCGCLKQSIGEYTITQLLQQNNCNFIAEKSFDDCIFPESHHLARFDFYVDNCYIIEYDGKQHFSAAPTGWNTSEHLEKTQQHDEYKNQWCKTHNIPLIRIPYTKLNTLCIEDLLLETTQFRVI